MIEIISSARDFKIIPSNFKSSGEFDLLEVNHETIKAKLKLLCVQELNDYKEGSCVEVFAVNNLGLIYFETKIISCNNDIIELKTTDNYSLIQRREYSRVGLDNGRISFSDLGQEFVKKIVDISAGGTKIITSQALETDRKYSITISLSNNMNISCKLQPIRITKRENGNYIISGKFVELENMDRIVLVQYAFKTKMEEQNIDNDMI